MTSNIDTADISEFRKMTWDLYYTCNSISGDAPDGFRQLVASLESLHGVFQNLGNDATSKNSEVGEDEERKNTLQRCLKSCSVTLQQLKEIVDMYRSLSFGTGKQLWQSIDWTTQQGFIDELNSKIVTHTCHLGLCVSSISHTSLERTESSATKTSAKDVPPPTPSSLQMQDEVSPISFSAPILRSHNVHIMPELDGTELANANTARQNTQHTPGDRTRVSASSESFVSGHSEGSIFTAATRTAPGTPATASFSPLHMVAPDACSTEKEVVWSRGPGAGVSGVQYQRQIQRSNSIKSGESSLWNSTGHHPRADAIQDLHQRQLREQLLRSLRFEPRDRFHQPDAELLVKFDNLSHKEERPQHLTAKGWLLVAVWWLLKARTSLANSEMPSLASHRGSTSPSTLSCTASHQAYVDLLKASYILYDIVLRMESPQMLSEDENKKLISDLSEGIKADFAQFSTVDIPDYATTHSQNLDIWEPVQPEETTGNECQASSPGNICYITVELEDAGNEDEQVIFRTFVNAGIGSKKLRMRTRGAPYMLLLSTRYGESEPKVTICNQHGTFCLQRDLTPGDLAQLIQVSSVSLTGLPTRITEPVTLKFDTISVSVSFQYLSDMMQVINMPKAYFDAVQLREPLESDQFTETVVFKNSAEMLELLRMPNMTSTRPPTVYRSCEVRILERSFKEAWRSVRRIVICSSTADSSGQIMEFFMPLSHVQVSRTKASGFMLLKWSDTGQERSSKTDGNYHPLYSYVYDGSNPNIGISIQFRSQEQADGLEMAVLGRSTEPVFTWSQTKSSGQVYDVVDGALDGKRYKAVMLGRTRGEWKQCSLHYLFRDMDYVYDHSTLRVKFPHSLYANYISSHVDQLYCADQRVFFSHCEKEFRDMVVEFNDEHILRAFMTSLAPSHELIYSRRSTSLMTKDKLLLGPRKSVKGDSQVQLWRDSEALRLAARWNDHIMDRWLTMTIPSSELSRVGNLVSFPPSSYSRGMILNMSKIAAGAAKNPSREHKVGPITIMFPNQKDQEDFVSAIAGSHLK